MNHEILSLKLLNIQNKILIESVKKFGLGYKAKVWAYQELKQQVPAVVKAALKYGVDLMITD